MRASGILLPIASLPGNYGIGAFSKEAYEFVDLLVEAGQKYWQILPLGPTSYGDSPYQSFSTFAGNPYFIDLDMLIKEGVLTEKECKKCDFGTNPREIDYGKIYESRFALLRIAYERSAVGKNQEFLDFQNRNSWWLRDYAVFMTVKKIFGDISFEHWAEDIRLRYGYAMEYYQREYYYEVEFYEYLQYVFEKQWKKLKAYANEKGVSIIGDIPIYVAFDSADAWAHPELFQFDENRVPIAVAGCPPDGFSATGQLWGNPLYRWDYHRETGYAWWKQRLERSKELYDVVRIDHFRGLEAYYSIPYGHETAEFGHWEPGPGIDFIRSIQGALADVSIIAEDLGYMTDSVKQLVKDSGFPNMKVLEFAFDSREGADYLPHTYDKNCVVYTGTHDNETIVQWYESISKEDKEFSKEYMDNADTKKEEIHWDFIRLAQFSVAKLCIIPVQDYLGYGSEARINHPSTVGKNWRWRLLETDLSKELLEKIKKITKLSGRL